jgi:hypothetical protein
MTGFDSEVATKAAGGKAGVAYEFGWNATCGRVAFAFNTIGRLGLNLQQAAYGRDKMWRGALGSFTSLTLPTTNMQ